MEGLVSLIIEQRMAGLGWDNYGVKMTSVELSSAETVHMHNQNEYWFFVDVDDNTDEFIIQADNYMISSTDFMLGSMPFMPADFTGEMIISKPEHTTVQKLLFARVIPKF